MGHAFSLDYTPSPALPQQAKEGGALLPCARKYGLLAVAAPEYPNSAVESPFPSSLARVDTALREGPGMG